MDYLIVGLLIYTAGGISICYDTIKELKEEIRSFNKHQFGVEKVKSGWVKNEQ